jgi:hypothetical protein
VGVIQKKSHIKVAAGALVTIIMNGVVVVERKPEGF